MATGNELSSITTGSDSPTNPRHVTVSHDVRARALTKLKLGPIP